jgi:hypothetical protein
MIIRVGRRPGTRPGLRGSGSGPGPPGRAAAGPAGHPSHAMTQPAVISAMMMAGQRHNDSD